MENDLSPEIIFSSYFMYPQVTPLTDPQIRQPIVDAGWMEAFALQVDTSISDYFLLLHSRFALYLK